MEILILNSKGGCGKTTLAMALTDVLDAQIVEHDLQGTIANCHMLTGRHKPVELKYATSKFIIHDTPPYNSDILRELIKRANKIIVPVRMSAADLVACKTAIDLLREAKAVDRTTIVFNGVRKPYTNAYRDFKEAFSDNYKDVAKATTEITNLVAFQRVMEMPVTGKAKQLISELLTELNVN